MKIDGNLKADELRVGRIVIDYLRDPMEISALAALILNEDGQTLGWTKAQGAWSEETRDALNKLRSCMEEDIHKVLFGSERTTKTKSGKGLTVGGGLGEHLEGKDDAPQV
jgi:hypothetical protein